MDSTAIISWLKLTKRKNAALDLLFSLFSFLGAVVILFFTFWFTYAVVYIGWSGISAVSELIFSKRLHLTHGWRLITSGIFVRLLFVQCSRTDRWHWGDYPARKYVSAPGMHAGAGGSLV